MAKQSLNSAEVRDMMLQVAAKIIEAEPYLSEADRQLGDGDHGIGMERGMKAVQEELANDQPAEVGKVFMNAGKAMMASMGGASGAIFGTVFLNGGRAIKTDESFTAKEAALFFQAALDGVVKRGKAKVGDKTCVDALSPAADAAQQVAGQALPEAISAISDATEAGKEASKDMIATMGRAKTLGEKSLGKPDAGACSIAIIVATMRDYIAA